MYYTVAGTSQGPNEALAYIDVAESADEILVRLFESVTHDIRPLAAVPQCVDIPLTHPLEDRVVRDGNARRGDERRGTHLDLRGALVARLEPRASRHACHDWISAPAESRSGPRRWPGGTEHRRLSPPSGP